MKRFFFEKNNQKTFVSLVHAVGESRDSGCSAGSYKVPEMPFYLARSLQAQWNQRGEA